MTLQRKAIRRGIVQALMGHTYAGNRVHEGAPTSFRPDVDGPCALYVYSLTDAKVEGGGADSGRLYSRDLEVAVDVWVDEDQRRREDLLDDLTGQVEILVGAALPKLHHLKVGPAEDAEAVGGNPSRSGWERVEMGFDVKGRELLASARVVFTVNYETKDDPERVAEIVDLDGASVWWDYPPPDFDVEAQDEIDTSGG